MCSTPWDRRWGLFSWPSGKIVYLVLEKLWPREEKSESGWQIRNWLQEILDELGPHSVLPRLCPERWWHRKSWVFPSVRVVPCL